MRSTVLRLYKDLMRYGQGLKLTNEKYFCRRIRRAFKANKRLTDQAAIEFQLQKAQRFLEYRRVV